MKESGTMVMSETWPFMWAVVSEWMEPGTSWPVQPMYEESEASYNALFDSMKARGLQSVWLVVSDAHAGLVSSVRKSFVGACWQRCKVHFMRNIMAHIPASEKESFGVKLKQIWMQPDHDSAV